VIVGGQGIFRPAPKMGVYLFLPLDLIQFSDR